MRQLQRVQNLLYKEAMVVLERTGGVKRSRGGLPRVLAGYCHGEYEINTELN